MRFDLEKVIATIEGVSGFKVFGTDMKKDEVDDNNSFFIFDDKGDIRKASSANQYLQDFVLSFITKENAEIKEFDLIIGLGRMGLIFRETEKEYGRMANTENEAKMITFYFHQPLVVC